MCFKSAFRVAADRRAVASQNFRSTPIATAVGFLTQRHRPEKERERERERERGRGEEDATKIDLVGTR